MSGADQPPSEQWTMSSIQYVPPPEWVLVTREVEDHVVIRTDKMLVRGRGVLVRVMVYERRSGDVVAMTTTFVPAEDP